MRHCFKRAMRGSARHFELLVAYVEGKPKQGVELSGPDGGAMKFENMSDAELGHPTQGSTGKVSGGKQMIQQQKVELTELLEERMFRREPFKFAQAKHTDINGVEHTILVVKLKLRPPHIVAKIGQR